MAVRRWIIVTDCEGEIAACAAAGNDICKAVRKVVAKLQRGRLSQWI